MKQMIDALNNFEFTPTHINSFIVEIDENHFPSTKRWLGDTYEKGNAIFSRISVKWISIRTRGIIENNTHIPVKFYERYTGDFRETKN